MRRISECRQLLIGMSISRYLPPIGTAGLDRECVRGNRRVPRPPPKMIASTSRMAPEDMWEPREAAIAAALWTFFQFVVLWCPRRYKRVLSWYADASRNGPRGRSMALTVT